MESLCGALDALTAAGIQPGHGEESERRYDEDGVNHHNLQTSAQR